MAVLAGIAFVILRVGIGGEALTQRAQTALQTVLGPAAVATINSAQISLDQRHHVALEARDVNITDAKRGIQINNVRSVRIGLATLPLLHGNMASSDWSSTARRSRSPRLCRSISCLWCPRTIAALSISTVHRRQFSRVSKARYCCSISVRRAISRLQIQRLTSPSPERRNVCASSISIYRKPVGRSPSMARWSGAESKSISMLRPSDRRSERRSKLFHWPSARFRSQVNSVRPLYLTLTASSPMAPI